MTGKRMEEYIEVIYEIWQKLGNVKVKEVARKMGVSNPTVTERFQNLAAEGLVNYHRYGGVTLTEKGEEIAKELEKKHKALRDFLLTLGLDKEIADADACKIEHIADQRTVELLDIFLRYVNERGTPGWLKGFKSYYNNIKERVK